MKNKMKSFNKSWINERLSWFFHLLDVNGDIEVSNILSLQILQRICSSRQCSWYSNFIVKKIILIHSVNLIIISDNRRSVWSPEKNEKQNSCYDIPHVDVAKW